MIWNTNYYCLKIQTVWIISVRTIPTTTKYSTSNLNICNHIQCAILTNSHAIETVDWNRNLPDTRDVYPPKAKIKIKNLIYNAKTWQVEVGLEEYQVRWDKERDKEKNTTYKFTTKTCDSHLFSSCCCYFFFILVFSNTIHVTCSQNLDNFKPSYYKFKKKIGLLDLLKLFEQLLFLSVSYNVNHSFVTYFVAWDEAWS